MSTLDELRRWARGESVDGLPKRLRKEIPKPALGAVSGRTRGKYKVNAEGTDALVLFGNVCNGEKLSVIVTTPRGRKYMNWIIGQDFDETFKAVCRYQLELFKQNERESK